MQEGAFNAEMRATLLTFKLQKRSNFNNNVYLWFINVLEFIYGANQRDKLPSARLYFNEKKIDWIHF